MVTAIERSRRQWAETQEPRLATVQQIADMLGHKKGTWIRKIMSANKVEPAYWDDDPRPGEPYYDYEAASLVARSHRANMAQRAAKVKAERQDERPPSPSTRFAGVRISRPQGSNWSRQQLEMAYVDRDEAVNAIALLFRRCPSFTQFSYEDAKSFVAVLVHDVHQRDGGKYDISQYTSELRRLTRNESERAVAERSMRTYYEAFEQFGHLAPATTAAVLLELLRSK